MSTTLNATSPKVVNARVVCRIRPQSLNEKKNGGLSCIDHSNNGIEVYTSLGQYPFECDHIFDETTTQADLFNYCAKPHVVMHYPVSTQQSLHSVKQGQGKHIQLKVILMIPIGSELFLGL